VIKKATTENAIAAIDGNICRAVPVINQLVERSQESGNNLLQK
jgi:hypothetical protein